MLPPGRLALDPLLGSALTNDKITYIAFGIAVSLIPWRPFIAAAGGRYRFGPVAAGASLVLACYAAVMLSVGSFTPFIYFRF